MSAQPTTSHRSREQVSIDRAVAKALEQAEAGNLPRLLRQEIASDATRQVWGVGSRTTGGTVYTVDLTASVDGIETHCDCTGGGHAVCWHRAACRMAVLGDIPWRDGRRPARPVASLAVLVGR